MQNIQNTGNKEKTKKKKEKKNPFQPVTGVVSYKIINISESCAWRGISHQ